MILEVAIVNAFVANGHGGNPAGVVMDATRLTDKQMQHIACQIGASETAFILVDKNATRQLRFFTPTVEVDLCGHATIAAWSYMYNHGCIKAGNYTQNTLAGIINISIDKAGLVFMQQPPQKFRQILDFAVIARGLNISESIFDISFEPQIVREALMLSLKSKDMLNKFKLDAAKLIDLNKTYNFKALHIFVMLNKEDYIAAVRSFDPIVGIYEDAATGVTNGSFLTYLRHYNKLPAQEIYKIEQGESMGQLSHVYGKFEDDRVWIGGKTQENSTRQIELL